MEAKEINSLRYFDFRRIYISSALSDMSDQPALITEGSIGTDNYQTYSDNTFQFKGLPSIHSWVKVDNEYGIRHTLTRCLEYDNYKAQWIYCG